MRFKLGYVSGFATGYYLGTKAGRQRYDQINRTLRKVRRSDALETASEKVAVPVLERVKGTVKDSALVGKVQSLVHKGGTNGTSDGVRATQAGEGVRATQAGEGVRATQAGEGVRATQAGPAADGSPNGTNTIPAAAPLTGQPTIAPPPVAPPPTAPGSGGPYSSSK